MARPAWIEFYTLITPDGEEINLDNRVTKFLGGVTGFGIPPIERKVQRGPFQNGDTEVDYFLRPRIITLLLHENADCRDAYWTIRDALIDAVRPNRQITLGAVIPHVLRTVRSDGVRRDIGVRVQTGPVFAPTQDGWDEWSYREAVQFFAPDPTFYDPTEVEGSATLPVFTELEFPITFPIQFGNAAMDEDIVINYAGDWLSFPVIEIDGPLRDPIITNDVTGEFIHLSYNIEEGDTITLDLAYAAKTVENAAGDNLIGIVQPSNFATFAIHPDPLAPNGVNTINVVGNNADFVNTEVRINYFNRYIGL
jgi:hypothetical protein